MTKRVTPEYLKYVSLEASTKPQYDRLMELLAHKWKIYAYRALTAGGAVISVSITDGQFHRFGCVMPDGSLRLPTKGKKKIEWTWSVVEQMYKDAEKR